MKGGPELAPVEMDWVPTSAVGDSQGAAEQGAVEHDVTVVPVDPSMTQNT